MPILIIACLLWLAIHLGISGTRLRDRLVLRLGERPFQGLFSLLSIAAILFMGRAWDGAPAELLWDTPSWLRWLLALIMLLAFVLFVASLTRPNPTAVGATNAVAQPPRGMQRVTRHPMLWSFALWAAVHIAANGDTSAIVFFGTFLVTALAGMPSIDAKLARRDPATWQALSAATSIVPFSAIVQGRNRLVPREIGWLTPLVAVVAWAAVLLLHPWLFGAYPLR
jgi:uncharacterized membrane protein